MSYVVALILPYLARIALAALIWFAGGKAVTFLVQLVEKRMNKVQVDQSLHSFLLPLVKITLQLLLILTVAATVGIEITTFAAIVGAAGFAVGLAFQGSLANFAGGVLILVLKPFRVGDFIQAAGFSGTVREIQVFHTVLTTLENQKVIIPNAELSNSSAVNYSAYERRRTNLKLSIPYREDLQKVKQVLEEVIAAQPLILKDPPAAVVVGGFESHGIALYVRVWADLGDYWTMYFSFLEQIKQAFDQAGVQLAHPQLDVHLKPPD